MCFFHCSDRRLCLILPYPSPNIHHASPHRGVSTHRTFLVLEIQPVRSQKNSLVLDTDKLYITEENMCCSRPPGLMLCLLLRSCFKRNGKDNSLMMDLQDLHQSGDVTGAAAILRVPSVNPQHQLDGDIVFCCDAAFRDGSCSVYIASVG